MLRWWRRNRVSEDIATEVDNGNTTLAVPWWERLITVVLWITVGAFLLVTFIAVIVPGVFPMWFGVQAVEVTDPNVRHYTPQRTLWDWFGLIAIPLAIVVVGYILNRADRAHERRLQDQRIKESRDIEEKRLAESQRIEQDRTQDIVVKDYLDQMTELLLTRGLRTSFEGDEVRSVARARTLTALRAVDGERKTTIVRFLYEAQLIGCLNGEEVVAAVVHLREADLSGARLGGANLERACLSGSSLNNATLGRANLVNVNLTGADLRGASLRGASLINANLNRADLSRASLRASDLNRADLSRADLNRADLSGADLTGAILRKVMLCEAIFCRAMLHGVDFSGAVLGLPDDIFDGADLTDCHGLTSEQLLEAKYLHGATLPDYINPADLGDKWSPPQDEAAPSSLTPVQ